MQLFYDFLFTVNNTYEIIDTDFGSEDSRRNYALLFRDWISRKRCITSVFPLSPEDWEGDFTWDNDLFHYKRLPAPHNGYYYSIIRHDYKEDLLVASLDLLTDGVQIYDQNGYAVFINKAGRKISQIPSSIDVKNRHLLDLFVLDENVSTVMTSLRRQTPVINRVDHYQSIEGASIASANTSYPIKKGSRLIGAVAFEQTQEIVNTYKEKMSSVEKALRAYQGSLPPTRFSGYTFKHVIGHGEALSKAVNVAIKIASQNSSVLLTGETGTGKEIFAQSIHRSSQRKHKKFVALNCAAIPDSLIESLLFGTQKGSFTGSENKPGYFEEAEGGTLFLDEMNSMSLAMQSKILRALQENSFRRVGGQKDIPMDVRIISSCNRDPFQCIEENQLRKDLFYRLSTVMIELPPLRKHMEDLEELVRYHLSATAFQYVHSASDLSREAYEILKNYDFPGNVRELFHILDYAQNIVDGDTILPEHLPSYLLKAGEEALPAEIGTASSPAFTYSSGTLQSLMDEYEHKILLSALEHYGYNITKTAQALGLRRQSLQYRIHKYGLQI